MLKKKIWANFQRIIELFTQKTVTKLSKIWVWDTRYGIQKNLFQNPDPGVKKTPDPGFGSATLLGCSSRIRIPDPDLDFKIWFIPELQISSIFF
jgi:hypothetical protein